MPNPTSALLPNTAVTPNVPNTAPSTQIIGANPARNALIISNISANVLWLSGPGVTAVGGTIQQGQFTLAVGATMIFGALVTGGPVCFPWIWTQAMFAIAAAGASNAVTVLEF